MREVSENFLCLPLLVFCCFDCFSLILAYGIGGQWPTAAPTPSWNLSGTAATTTLSPFYWQYITGGYFQPLYPDSNNQSSVPCASVFPVDRCSPPVSNVAGPVTLPPFFPTSPSPGFPFNTGAFNPNSGNNVPPFSGNIPTLFPVFPTPANAPWPSTPVSRPNGSGGGTPSGGDTGTSSGQVPDRAGGSGSLTPLESSNLLSATVSDFLSSLTKEQLVSFFRAFFMSQSMGASSVDLKVPVSRSLMPIDRHVVEVVRSIPAGTGNLEAMVQTGLGRLLTDFARKAGSATRRERTSVMRSYHKTIADLRLPKGIKYALRHVQI